MALIHRGSCDDLDVLAVNQSSYSSSFPRSDGSHWIFHCIRPTSTLGHTGHTLLPLLSSNDWPYTTTPPKQCGQNRQRTSSRPQRGEACSTSGGRTGREGTSRIGTVLAMHPALVQSRQSPSSPNSLLWIGSPALPNKRPHVTRSNIWSAFLVQPSVMFHGDHLQRSASSSGNKRLMRCPTSMYEQPPLRAATKYSRL